MDYNASILSLSTAVPPYAFNQEEIAEKMIAVLDMDDDKKDKVRYLYQHSAIQKRHAVLPDFKKDRSEWHFWGSDYPASVPGMTQRNLVYKKEAPQLAYQAAKQAIDSWGGDPSKLTHIISVSCTGLMAPGIEFELISSLDLNRSIHRFGINFMGCFGAFKGLAVAQAFAKENPQHRILVVCTELCSLHLQAAPTNDNILGNALFSDGAAAVIVGAEPTSSERSLWHIVKQQCFGLDKTLDKMSWEASDQGFIMKLSPFVPVIIGQHIGKFTQTLIGQEAVPSACNWAIHPGGKSIVQAIEKAMKLESNQTKASWETLAQYGNMSSATFLFVLDEILRQKSQQEWTIGAGFGPGLSMEGILLRSPSASTT